MDRSSWHCTGDRNQDHPQEKEMQKGKWLSEEALQIGEKRREAKGKWEKEKYIHLNVEFERIVQRDKSLPQWSMQRNRGKKKNGKN